MYTGQGNAAYPIGGAGLLTPAGEFDRVANQRATQAHQACEKTYADKPYRPSIAERIEKAIAAGESAVKRAQAAYEARAIIEQNPEFARLLDLLDRF